MSSEIPSPVPEEVFIWVLAGAHSGASVFIGRYMEDLYITKYNPDLDGYRRRTTTEDKPVVVELGKYPADTSVPVSQFCDYLKRVNALLLVANPATPTAERQMIKTRLHVLRPLIGDEKSERIPEAVVILKDIDAPWGVALEELENGDCEYADADTEGPEEREWLWRAGALEGGYEMGLRLGIEVTIACGRTGEGVTEAVEGLVAQVLSRRRDRRGEVSEKAKQEHCSGAT